MIYLKLRQAGEIVNHKRVERLYTQKSCRSGVVDLYSKLRDQHRVRSTLLAEMLDHAFDVSLYNRG